MQRYALIGADAIVVDVVLWDGSDSWTPPAHLTPVASDYAGPGWRREEGGEFTPPQSATPAPEKPKTVAQCLKALADRRWWKTQTFTYDGVETQADDAIAVVNATLALRQRRGVPAEYPQTWKLGASEFRQWDETQIEAFGFAIADHIQACFEREAELTALIIAAEDPSDVDTSTGWPG